MNAWSNIAQCTMTYRVQCISTISVWQRVREATAVAATAVINDYNNNDTASTNLNSSFLVDFRCFAGGCLPACLQHYTHYRDRAHSITHTRHTARTKLVYVAQLLIQFNSFGCSTVDDSTIYTPCTQYIQRRAKHMIRNSVFCGIAAAAAVADCAVHSMTPAAIGTPVATILSKWISKMCWELENSGNERNEMWRNKGIMKMKHADCSINKHNYQHRTILFRITLHARIEREEKREEQTNEKKQNIMFAYSMQQSVDCRHRRLSHSQRYRTAWKYVVWNVHANMRYAIFQIAILCSQQ